MTDKIIIKPGDRVRVELPDSAVPNPQSAIRNRRVRRSVMKMIRSMPDAALPQSNSSTSARAFNPSRSPPTSPITPARAP
ncbi:MAG: hypothetical protein M3458_05365 [Acidobacteriota bacterium]|nr:hypothetical protein [Acidobacteriota bacterium]